MDDGSSRGVRGQVSGGSMAPIASHNSDMQLGKPHAKAKLVNPAQNEDAASSRCSKSSSCEGNEIAYGEPAGEMGVRRSKKCCALRSGAGQTHRIRPMYAWKYCKANLSNYQSYSGGQQLTEDQMHGSTDRAQPSPSQRSQRPEAPRLVQSSVYPVPGTPGSHNGSLFLCLHNYISRRNEGE
jgi:hypothetical protein